MMIGKLLSRFTLVMGISAGVMLLAVGLFIFVSPGKLPTFESLRANSGRSDVWILDRHGQELESIRNKQEKRALEWTEWSDVSYAFKDILVRAEDRRFYWHPGVDPMSLGRAFFGQMNGGIRSGASTITMQLVGLIKGGKRLGRRDVFEKVDQMSSSIRLTASWSKEQVLEAYINLVSFRGELVGLRAASLGYFGKHPAGLSENESALLVALLPAPNAPAKSVGQRACRILNRTSCEELEHLADESFSKPYSLPRSRDMVPVLASQIIEGRSAHGDINTSIDAGTQDFALKSLQAQLRSLKTQNVRDGAVIVLETRTGRVAAYVANAGAKTASASQVDGMKMRRQAGSTIKPFVYATAFDLNLLDQTSLLDDSPADINVSHGRVYHPRNYDHVFRGLVSVGDALGSSMNVPAVRAIQLVGEVNVLDRMRAAGFSGLEDDEFYGPSLALGSVDVSLWELTNAYRRFASDDSPFKKSTREVIFNILALPEYRRHTFGTDSVLSLPFPAAVKTGTSKDMRDNWCVGWTSEYTVGVWVGNFNGEPMWNVSGVSGAAPIWRSLMVALNRGKTHAPVPKYLPASLPLTARTLTKIRYPAPDMIVGVDPEIPDDLQKLPIEIENPQAGHKIFINDELLGDAQKTLFWPVTPGRFSISLRDGVGDQVDKVSIEVR